MFGLPKSMQLIIVAVMICAVACNTLPWTSEQAKTRLSIALQNVQTADPRIIPDFNRPVSFGSAVNVNLEFSQVVIRGLSSYTITRLDASNIPGQLQVEFGQTIPNITLTFRVKTSGVISGYEVNDLGDIRSEVVNAHSSGPIFMNVNNGQLQVQGMGLDCTMQQLKLHYEDVSGSYFAYYKNRIANYLMSTYSTVFFNGVKPAIIEVLSNTLKDSLNAQLQLQA